MGHIHLHVTCVNPPDLEGFHGPMQQWSILSMPSSAGPSVGSEASKGVG